MSDDPSFLGRFQLSVSFRIDLLSDSFVVKKNKTIVFRTILQAQVDKTTTTLIKRVTHARAQASIQYKLGSTCDLKTSRCLPGTVGKEGKQRYSSFTVRAGDDILWRPLV